MIVPQLEFVFEVKLEFENRLRFGPTYSGGMIGFVGISGGTVKGPRLNAQAVPHSGGDWAEVRPDGVVVFCAHYLLKADDGTLIHVHNRGYGRAAPKPLAEGEAFVDQELREHYFRVTPTFGVPVGPHDWLTRTVILGAAERKREPDHTVFNYFAVM